MHFARMIVCLLFSVIVLRPAFASSIFDTGGCLPLKEFRSQQQDIGMHILASLEGNSFFMPLIEDYRYELGTYGAGPTRRVVLFSSDMPMGSKSTKACIWFASDGTKTEIADLAPSAPAARAWPIPSDVNSIRAYCANKILPAMIEMDNKKQKMVGGVWMTAAEEHLAMAKILGENQEAAKKKWEQPDVDRIARAHEKMDRYCAEIGELTDQIKGRQGKLALLATGKHLWANGKTFSEGALAVFVPSASAKPEHRGDWDLYMVFKDGRAYLLADGTKSQVSASKTMQRH